MSVCFANNAARDSEIDYPTELLFRSFILTAVYLWVHVSTEVESDLKLTDRNLFALTGANKWLRKKKAQGMPSLVIIENIISQPWLSQVVCPPPPPEHTHTHSRTHILCLRPLRNPFYTKRLCRKETWISGVSWMRFISQKDNVARPTLNHVKIF